MDDCFTPWPKAMDIFTFKNLLNNLDENIRFTLDPAEHFNKGCEIYQKLNFLDITVILHKNGKVDTDIYYKDTNTHDYLDYHSDHPTHIKNNIPFNLAKRIIVFCSKENTEKKRLSELKEWLIKSNYQINIIDRGFKNAKLQRPANRPNSKNNITFVTTHAPNYDTKTRSRKAERLLNDCRDEKLKNIFGNTKVILALRQPRHILHLVTSANFESVNSPKSPNGFYKCTDVMSTLQTIRTRMHILLHIKQCKMEYQRTYHVPEQMYIVFP